MKFGGRLKAIRLENGKTQKDMYEALKISANGYASYEQGRTKPSIETLVRIFQILDVSADDLLGLNE